MGAKNVLFGLNHIGIYTQDLAESVRFYTDVLGFERRFDAPPGEGGDVDITVLRMGGLEIELIEMLDQTRDVRAEAAATLNHVALACSDTNACVEMLREKGVAFETEKANYAADFGPKGHDIRYIFLQGPSGERIEIFQEIYQNA